jgi:hypothetical protein
MNDQGLRISPDGMRINLGEAHDVSYWCAVLNVAPTQLRLAVEAVGTSVDKVKAFLEAADHDAPGAGVAVPTRRTDSQPSHPTPEPTHVPHR